MYSTFVFSPILITILSCKGSNDQLSDSSTFANNLILTSLSKIAGETAFGFIMTCPSINSLSSKSIFFKSLEIGIDRNKITINKTVFKITKNKNLFFLTPKIINLQFQQ